MSKINLAFNLELNDDLSKEVLASITSALIMDLSKDSFKTVAKVIAEQGIHNGTTGTVNITTLDETKTLKAGAKLALEAVAGICNEHAAEHNASVLIALSDNPRDPETLKDIHTEFGRAEGFRAAAALVREAEQGL